MAKRRDREHLAARLLLAGCLVLSSGAAAFAAAVQGLGSAPHDAAQMIQGALAGPPAVARIDASLPLSLGLNAALVPVASPDLLSAPEYDHARLAAFVERSRDVNGVVLPAPAAGFGEMNELGYDFEEWRWTPPRLFRPKTPEDLIVRGGKPETEKIERFLSREHGRNRSREILAAATGVLAGLPLERISTLNSEELRRVSERIFERLPEETPVEAVTARPDAGAERPRVYTFPTKDWGVAVQGFLDRLGPAGRAGLFAGRAGLRAGFENLPELKRLDAAIVGPDSDGLIGPVAAALEEEGLSSRSFARLSPRAQRARFERALARAGTLVEEDAAERIAKSRREITTPSALKADADEMLGLLAGPAVYLTGPGRRRLQQAYDEAHSLLYAGELGRGESVVVGLASDLGLRAKRYSHRLGGVIVTGSEQPAANPAGRRDPAQDDAAFAAIKADTVGWYYEQGLRRKWTTYFGRWTLARRFHEPAVAAPDRLTADLAVVGMNGEFDPVGLRGYSHSLVYRDIREAFRRHFGALGRDPQATWALEGLFSRVFDWLPDHFPIKFGKVMAEHLRKAALLPAEEVVDYLHRASPLDDKYAEDSFRDGEQEKVLKEFIAVVDESLREEASRGEPEHRVVGVVLTGSYVRLAARPGSDFDIQLVTADGGTRRLQPFMERVQERWRARGRREPINPFQYALTPSVGLIQMVHRGPHIVIAPDASFLAPLADRVSGPAVVERGVFETPRSERSGYRAMLQPLLRRLLASFQAEDRKSGRTEPPPSRLIAYFPGLGSRGAYRGAGAELWDSGIPEVRDVYRRAAAALGLDSPRRLFLTLENLPKDRERKAGFIAASFLTYNVALAARMSREAADGGTPVSFQAYSGDSLGILTASVASGALSIEDGARIASFLLPALSRAQTSSGIEPQHLLTIEYYEPRALIHAARERFGAAFEVYRDYSGVRLKAYVAESARTEFDLWLAQEFPVAGARDDAPPTSAVYHSAKLAEVRGSLERFLADREIAAPNAPIVSNNGAGLITTAAGVRAALLAMVDEPMKSAQMVREVDALKPDLVVEVGLGDKGGALFGANHMRTPAISFDGRPERLDGMQRTIARGPFWRRPD